MLDKETIVAFAKVVARNAVAVGENQIYCRYCRAERRLQFHESAFSADLDHDAGCIFVAANEVIERPASIDYLFMPTAEGK